MEKHFISDCSLCILGLAMQLLQVGRIKTCKNEQKELVCLAFRALIMLFDIQFTFEK